MGFFDPGAAIVERLEAKLAAAELEVDVRTAIDAGAIEDEPQDAPCVYVIFQGYRPTQAVGEGVVQQIEQIWLAVVALKHVSGVAADNSLPLHSEAAPYIDAVLGALCGWRPAQQFMQMKLGEGTGPSFTTGWAYYPLQFTTRTVVRGVD